MSKTLSHLMALALTLGVSHAAMAQDTPPAAPNGDAPASQGLSMGATEADPNAPGAMRVADTFGAWEQRCIREDADTERCQLYQLLEDGEGNNVAEFSLFNLPEGNEAAAGATIIVPLETLLTANLSVKVDSAQPRIYPFSWCSEIGCIARVGFTQGEVDALRRGSNAQLTIVPVVAPDQRVTLDMSLSGFTAGWDAVVAANAAE